MHARDANSKQKEPGPGFEPATSRFDGRALNHPPPESNLQIPRAKIGIFYTSQLAASTITVHVSLLFSPPPTHTPTQRNMFHLKKKLILQQQEAPNEADFI